MISSRRNAAQIADVADVFGDGEVRIEAEGLRQIAGVRARFAGRHAEDLGGAGGGLHDARRGSERWRSCPRRRVRSGRRFRRRGLRDRCRARPRPRRSASRARERDGRIAADCDWRAAATVMVTVITLKRPRARRCPGPGFRHRPACRVWQNRSALFELEFDADHLLHPVVAEVGVFGREGGLRIDARDVSIDRLCRAPNRDRRARAGRSSPCRSALRARSRADRPCSDRAA